MRILITGATGYLGARVAAALVVAGHQVSGLCRPGSERRLPAGCAPVAGDILDPVSLRRAVEGREAVVHMSAMVQKWARDRSRFDGVNIGGTESILDAAEAAGVGRVLYTSSIVALGPTDGAVGDEDWTRRRHDYFTDYERTKWLGLERVRERIARGAPIVIVYPGIVFGPGASSEGNLLQPTLVDYQAGRLRVRLGRGDLRICYAYIEDVARGHLLALTRGAPGRGYVLGGENATLDRIFEILQASTGYPPPRIAVPYWLGELLGSALTLGARLTGRLPEVTSGVVATFRHEWAYESARAQRELGYQITLLPEAMRRTLAALGTRAS